MTILPHHVVCYDRVGVCAIDDRLELRTQGSCLGLVCDILGANETVVEPVEIGLVKALLQKTANATRRRRDGRVGGDVGFTDRCTSITALVMLSI